MKLGNKISLILWIVAISGMIYWYLDGMPDKSKFRRGNEQARRMEDVRILRGQK